MQKDKKEAIVFAPHPDDETLGCGGTIAKRLSEGYNVYVVFMTDGRHSLAEFGISSGPTPSEMKEIRREEAKRAMKILGLQERNLLFLDFEDKTLEKHESLVQERIVDILKDTSPEEVFLPQEKEYNTDHRVTNLITKRAIEVSNLHPIEYQYTIAWSFPFYLLMHVMNERTFDYLTSNFLKRDLIRVDVSRFFPLKEMAIKEYRSQITLLSSGQRRPVLKRSFVKEFLKDREKFFVE